jgi:hypothetical protein
MLESNVRDNVLLQEMGSSQFPKFKKWIKDGILADFSKAWGE